MKNTASHLGKNQRKVIRKYAPIFLFPTLIAFIIGFVWPFVWGLYLSFFRFRTLSKTTFVGFQNYVKVFSDQSFLYSFVFTLAFTLISVLIINVFSFTVAYFLTKKIKGSTLFRTVFFLPNLIGGIVLGYLWKIILDALIIKYLNSSLALNSTYGFIGLLILVSWQQIGYFMIIYIAALQNVPSEQIEAAKIDGANGFQLLKNITIPAVMPSITICTFLTLTNGFKIFDQNLALTAGKPYNMTEMLALNIYNSFYESSTNMGVGQAKAVIFFIVVVVIALSQLYFTRSREVGN
ncbi:MAG: sugar ABC transporter permease [Clostridia bacterium]|nr:sugar ABC transporter permease [Clostridia bacterium]